MSAFYGWMCLTYSLHPVYHFLIEATHPCKPASFLCTVHALYCSLQTTVCLRAVWVLAVSYWRGVDVPRGAGEAIMMIFTMSDNECQGNPRLGPRSNTQTNNTHHACTLWWTKCHHETHTHTLTSWNPRHCLCLISLGTEFAGKSEAPNLAPRSRTWGSPKAFYADTHPPPPSSPPPLLPILTALFFYHTGNQKDSTALKSFLQLIDGDCGHRTWLMQPQAC